MIESRTVAVFTLDDCVRRFQDAFIFIRMAVFAIIPSLVLNFDFFPVLYISFSVPAIHKTPFVNAEIMRHIEESCNQDKYDNPDYYIKRSPYMVSHLIASKCKAGYGSEVIGYRHSITYHTDDLRPITYNLLFPVTL